MPCLYPGVSSIKKPVGLSLWGRVRRCFKNIPWTLQSWLWWIDFTHAYVGYVEDDGILWVYHCTALGVHRVTRSEFLQTREVYAELAVPVSDADFADFKKMARSGARIPYSNRQNIGAGLVRVAELMTLGFWKPKRMPRMFRTQTTAENCSETHGRVMTRYCKAKFNQRDPDLWVPAESLAEMRSLYRTRADTHWTKEPPA